jgi:hypothetical protein
LSAIVIRALNGNPSRTCATSRRTFGPSSRSSFRTGTTISTSGAAPGGDSTFMIESVPIGNERPL